MLCGARGRKGRHSAPVAALTTLAQHLLPQSLRAGQGRLGNRCPVDTCSRSCRGCSRKVYASLPPLSPSPAVPPARPPAVTGGCLSGPSGRWAGPLPHTVQPVPLLLSPPAPTWPRGAGSQDIRKLGFVAEPVECRRGSPRLGSPFLSLSLTLLIPFTCAWLLPVAWVTSPRARARGRGGVAPGQWKPLPLPVWHR